MATFQAKSFDYGAARAAADKLCDEADRSNEWDSGTVGLALDKSLDAFPGFRDFLKGYPGNDSGEPAINDDLISDEIDRALVDAMIDMAEVAASAELQSGFQWHDAERVEFLCRIALGRSSVTHTPG